ncbi:sarcoplasmic calcium-binding protein [Hyposmocoma kahamanoa]|uniref:sarcoplasmic calcium-binding protein n=1 Tax=Hyposmocoma kahamanoa TaxID=1477025 RepID=UPI000E6D7B67|nr:sarcoplasmic calcium-binding protein [Hyposmocoma kahamanoa]
MAISVLRIGWRAAANLEKAALFSCTSATNQFKLMHTQPVCTNNVCYLDNRGPSHEETVERATNAIRRYSKHHGRQEDRRQVRSDSDSDSESDTECKGIDRSDFWRRKMRTVHNILDVDKDGLISYNDFQLFAKRFIALGHLDEQQAKEFVEIIQMTWETQWGAIDPYNYVTMEQYLEDMNHVLNDKTLKKKAHRWLPYLFKALDKDKTGFISVKEFKLFFECLGLNNEHAAVAFAVIDHNGDGKLSLKEFVKLGKDFFFTEDEKRPSKMFWGPLSNV